jgi:alpha-beta hydrolase superfamily lysophospholipase
MKRAFVLTAIFTITINLAVSTNSGAITPGTDEDPASDYAKEGDQSVNQQALGNSCTLYSPASMTEDHPVVIWGNGTGAKPSSYTSLLRHWASWGFVVVAANTTGAGSGKEMLGCLDIVYSSLGNHLSDRVATSGHSQGGGGSIMAGKDSRVGTTVPVQPNALAAGVEFSAHSQQNGPMLLLSGSNDLVVPPVLHQQPIFDNANVPVFWATKQGVGHFEPAFDGGIFRGITTAWFLYKLKGDANATTLFEGDNCGFCDDKGWNVRRKDF